jgi:small subunit ribosomal protein S13
MVFFMQKNLRPHTRIRRALTQIYGINVFLANQLCDQLGFKSTMQVRQLSAAHLDKLARIVGHYHLTGQDLQRLIAQDISRYVRIGIYKGFRFTQGLPVRGQRTHTNAQNARRKSKPTPLR